MKILESFKLNNQIFLSKISKVYLVSIIHIESWSPFPGDWFSIENLHINLQYFPIGSLGVSLSEQKNILYKHQGGRVYIMMATLIHVLFDSSQELGAVNNKILWRGLHELASCYIFVTHLFCYFFKKVSFQGPANFINILFINS